MGRGWPYCEATLEGHGVSEIEQVGAGAGRRAFAGGDEATLVQGVEGALNVGAAEARGLRELSAAGAGAVAGVLDAGQVETDAELGFAEAWREGDEAQEGAGASFR